MPNEARSRKPPGRPERWAGLALAISLVLAFTAAAREPVIAAAAAEHPPNILFAIADDWGYPHAGVYGDRVVATPSFDRIAREGVLFEHAYAAAPSCTASRGAILTGLWPWRLGPGANLYGPVPEQHRFYPDLLEEAGYFVGSERKGWGPGTLPYRDTNPAGPRYESFAAFLEARPEGRPFAFWFGSSDPHRPYDAGSGREAGLDPAAIALAAHLPDAPEVRDDVADYYAEVQRFDRELGERLALLEARGELDRTLVVVTGDHGMPFPRCKANLYDCGTRVPLAMRWPARLAPGRRDAGFASLVDLAPTFLEAAGVATPTPLDGRSLLDLLDGSRPEAPDHVIFGLERHVPAQEAPDSGGTPMRAIRTRDYLYVRNLRPDRWPAGTPHYEKAWFRGSWYGEVDNGPTKLYMVEHRDLDGRHRRLFDLAFGKRPAEELYDLRADPAQLENLAQDSGHEPALRALSQRLDARLRATGDPRLLGGGETFDGYPYSGGSPLFPGFDEKEAGPPDRR